MARGTTIHKAEIQIADIDRGYYRDHALTIACHPSETAERMMVRLLAFVLHADEALVFGSGLSTQDEPDLWQKDLTGAIDLWIDVGQPDERDIRRACAKSKQVMVIAYGGRAVDLWWSQNRSRLEPLANLTVCVLPSAATQALAQLASRSMQLQCTIQERQVTIVSGPTVVALEPVTLSAAKS